MIDRKQINPIDAHIGRRVRNLRHRRGKSTKNIAIYLGFNHSDYIAHEDGKIRFCAEELFSLAELLETRISYFFGEFELRTHDDQQATDSAPTDQQAGRLLKFFSDIPHDNEREFLVNLAQDMSHAEKPKIKHNGTD